MVKMEKMAYMVSSQFQQMRLTAYFAAARKYQKINIINKIRNVLLKKEFGMVSDIDRDKFQSRGFLKVTSRSSGEIHRNKFRKGGDPWVRESRFVLRNNRK